MMVSVKRGRLQPGDVVADFAGRPLLRVERVEPARARGYVVVTGEPLRPGVSRTDVGGKASGVVQVIR